MKPIEKYDMQAAVEQLIDDMLAVKVAGDAAYRALSMAKEPAEREARSREHTAFVKEKRALAEAIAALTPTEKIVLLGAFVKRLRASLVETNKLLEIREELGAPHDLRVAADRTGPIYVPSATAHFILR